MSFNVKGHKLFDSDGKVNHLDTKKKSRGSMKPKYLVIHYTASDNFDGDVRTLSTASTKASCHLVLSPEGEITQIGKFTDVLWHAGKSKWKGISGLNRYSIGIEVTSPGPVEKVDGGFKTWYGRIAEGDYNYVFAKHKNGGKKKYWAGFTDKQIEVLKELVPFLMDAYKLDDVLGHDDISPLRKQDPGPCMPDALWDFFRGRDADTDDEVEEASNVTSMEEEKSEGKFIVTLPDEDDSLNVRRSPGGDKIGKVYHNLIVDVLKTQGNWSFIKTPGGYKGWVYSSYLMNYEA